LYTITTEDAIKKPSLMVAKRCGYVDTKTT